MSSRRERRARGPLDAVRGGAAVGLLLGHAGCDRGSPAPKPSEPVATSSAVGSSAPAGPSPTGSSAAPGASTLVNALALAADFAGEAVFDDAPARRTLFTWTTTEQIDALERKPTLLTRTESPKNGASLFYSELARRAQAGDALAVLLMRPAFRRVRFAWPVLWATLHGPGGESYGSELVRITLKQEAWILLFRTSQSELTAVDMGNAPVAAADVALHPERVAAVYFVNDGPGANGPQKPEARPFYREYVVCNESMVESFAARTDEVRRVVTASAKALAELADVLDAHPRTPEPIDSWNGSVPSRIWTRRKPGAALIEAYEAALAFPVEPYVPMPANVRKLSEELRALTLAGTPIEHTPTIAFDAAGPSAPRRAERLKPPPRRNGTFYN